MSSTKSICSPQIKSNENRSISVIKEIEMVSNIILSCPEMETIFVDKTMCM